jgi:Leucine-rich repeat (LRR) protein
MGINIELFDNAIQYLASNNVELGLILLNGGAIGTPEEIASEVENRYGETLSFVNRYAKDGKYKKLPAIEWWELMGLQTLDLYNNQLTSIPNFTGLANLQTLDLGYNRLTGIPNFTGLANLQTLHLHSNRLTSIPNFTGLANLQTLYLYNNQLTSSQMEAVKTALPNCETHHE